MSKTMDKTAPAQSNTHKTAPTQYVRYPLRLPAFCASRRGSIIDAQLPLNEYGGSSPLIGS
ncbi:hypothetical protein KSX_86430 [Ktedonospora formicarum]|uniref:Uncharacterized protein n=1 Tax=Ktedonospora formicarum TaxID=2778364 RepID=A0A8J3MZ71_9CHLR|nr:hypothetical protein KSX_86430 [Ktedonospora formicarum]